METAACLCGMLLVREHDRHQELLRELQLVAEPSRAFIVRYGSKADASILIVTSGARTSSSGQKPMLAISQPRPIVKQFGPEIIFWTEPYLNISNRSLSSCRCSHVERKQKLTPLCMAAF